MIADAQGIGGKTAPALAHVVRCQSFEHNNDWSDMLWRLFAGWLRWALEGGNTPLFIRTVAEAAGMPPANGRAHFLAWSGEESAPEETLAEINGLRISGPKAAGEAHARDPGVEQRPSARE